jgi:hypothetical protein
MKKWLALIIFAGCAQAPTKVENSVGGEPVGTVLADTRSHLEYTTYHVKGSVHLSSSDFLILKDARSKTRVLDPDLAQTVERLANKGISPLKTVVLVSETADAVENKKWNWLLRQLGVNDVNMISLAQFRVINSHLRPMPEPKRMPVWEIKNPKLILDNADKCFVNWSEETCVQK